MTGVSVEPVVVQRGAERAHAAVHHVARRDGVGAGLGLGDRRAGEQLERLVVVDDAVGAQHAAVAVRGVLAQAEVGDDQQVRMGGLDRPRGELDHALVVPRAGAFGVLARRQPEEQHGGDAERVRRSRPPRRPRRSRGGRSPASRRSACAAGRARRRTSDRRGARPRGRSRARGCAARRSGAGGAGGWRGRPSRLEGYPGAVAEAEIAASPFAELRAARGALLRSARDQHVALGTVHLWRRWRCLGGQVPALEVTWLHR